METARRTSHQSLLGRLVLTADAEGLTGVYFPAHRVLPDRALVGDEVDADPLLDCAAAQLDEYFAGDRTAFDLPLHPHPQALLDGAVWDLLRGIDFGSTTSYGDLARRLGDPHLAQSVGGAVGRNPLSIIIPCHRVVGADGSYTGFAGGEHRKAWLLGHEAYVSGQALLPPQWLGDEDPNAVGSGVGDG